MNPYYMTQLFIALEMDRDPLITPKSQMRRFSRMHRWLRNKYMKVRCPRHIRETFQEWHSLRRKVFKSPNGVEVTRILLAQREKEEAAARPNVGGIEVVR